MNRVIRSAAILIALMLTLPPAVQAATYTWNSNTSGSPVDGGGMWNTTSTNWWTGSVDQAWSNAGASTAQFGVGSGGSTAYTVNLSGSLSVGGLIFQNQAYTLSGGTLNLAGAAPVITVNASGGTIGSIITGTGGLTTGGTGTLTLTAANTYSGNTTLSGGEIFFTNNGAFGSGTLNLSGGTLYGSGVNPSNTVSATTGDNTVLQGNSGGSFLGLSGNIVGGGTLTIANTPGNVRFFGSNSGFTGTLVQTSGGGGFFLSGSNAGSAGAQWIINGTTTINGGTSLYSFGMLQGTGSILASSGTDTLSIGALNQNSTFGGSILNGSGVGALTIAGTATQTLTGANSYTGTTAVNSGTLVFGGAGSYTGGGSFTVGTATSAAALLINTSGTVAASGVSFPGNIAGTSVTLQSGTLLLGSGGMPGGAINGVLYFNGGTLKSSAAFALGGSMPIDILGGGGTVDTSGGSIASSSGFGYTGSTGNGTFTIQGGNTLKADFTSGSSWTGPVVVTGAGSELQNQGGNYAIQGSLTLGASTTYDLNGSGGTFGGLSGQGTVTDSGSAATLGIAGAGGNTFSGIIAGGTATSVSVNTTGTQVFSGSSTYTGSTTITAGTLAIGGAGVLGSGAYAGNIAISNGALLNYNSSAAQAFSGVISGSGGLLQSGNGTVSLTNSNAYTGGTVVNGGTLNLAYNNGGTGTLQGTLTINQGATVVAAVNNALGYTTPNTVQTININGGLLTTLATGDNGWGTTINMTGGTMAAGVAGGYFTMGTYNALSPPTFNITGTNTPALISANLVDRGDNSNPGITFNIARGSAASDLNITGNIYSSGGTSGITQTGNGILTLSGSNTYIGNTTIGGGTLALSGTGSLGSGNYAGAISNNGALLVNTSGANQTFGGVISGSGNFYQLGSGTTTLGGVNTYSGNTSLAAGELILNNSSALGNGSGTLTLSGGTLYGISANPSNPVSATTGVNTTLQGGSGGTFLGLSGNIVGGGTLTVANTPGNVRFFGNNSGFTGTLVQTSGGGGFFLSGSNAGSAGALWIINGTTTLNGGTGVYNFGALQGNGTVLATTGAETLAIGALNQNANFGGAIANSSGVAAVIINGSQVLSGANTYTGNTTINAGTLLIGSTGSLGGGNYAGNIAIGAAGLFNYNSSAAQTFSGAISGSGGLTQSGNSALGLYGANTYTGNTTISAGTLAVDGAGSLGGGNYAGNIAIGSGALLNYNSTAAQTFSGVISGSGGLTQSGNSVVTLSGSDTYSGNTTISAGTLAIGGTGSLTSGNYAGSVAIGSGALLNYNSSTAQTFSGVISGSGGLTQSGIVVLNLNGANTYSGNTAITAGTLVIGPAGVLGGGNYAGNIAIASGALLNNNSASSQTFGGVISGSGSLMQSVATVLTLNGANTFSGNTTITAGTLAIGGAGLLGGGNYAGNIAVANGALLKYNSTAAQTFSGVISGSGSLTQSGNGILSLTNNETISGPITASAGTMQFLSGSLAPPNLYVGSGGTASFVQSGGQVSGNLFVGNNATNVGAYSISSGTLVSANENIGNSGIGTFTQSGGTNAVSNTLKLAANNSGNGAYSLSGGLLTAPLENVASNGVANFTQTGGTNSITTSFIDIGSNSSASGSYNLSGTGLLSSPALYVGNFGSGTFTQSGGTVNVGLLELVPNASATGIYALNGGLLLVGSSGITAANSSYTFNFGGGTLASTVALSTPMNFTLTGNGGNANIAMTGGNVALSGVLSGSGGLNATAGNTLTLSGIDTYTGSTNISAGTLAIVGAGELGGGNYAGNIAFSSGALLNYNSTAAQTFGGVISGAGAILRSANSVLTLNGANTYSGNTSITAGTLAIGGAGSLGNGNYAGNIAVGSGALLNYNSTASQTFGGIISGSGALQQSGNSALSLNGVNTYTGNTTISAGTLAIGAAGSLGSGNYAGTISNSGALVVNTSSNQTFSGVIGGNGSFYQLGPGVTTLVGNNSFSGNATVNGGTLLVLSGQFAPSSLFVGSAGSASMIQMGGQVTSPNFVVCYNNGDVGSYTQSGGTNAVGNLLVGFATNSSGSYSLSGSGLLQATLEEIGGYGGGSFTQSGGTNAMTSTFNLEYGGVYNLSGGSLTAPSETLLGGSFTQSGGTNAMTGSFYNYNGSVYNLSGGSLSVSSEEFIGYQGTGIFTQTGGTHTVPGLLLLGADSGNGTYNLAGGLLQLGGLGQGGGTAVFNFSGGTLQALDSFSTGVPMQLVSGLASIDTQAYSLTLSAPISGSGSLQKLGAGSLILTNNNTYSGNTTISAGSLTIGGGLLGGGNYAGTIANNGTFAVNTSSNQTFAGVISGSGSFYQLGSGATSLTNANSYTGNTTLAAGEIYFNNNSALGSSAGTLTLSGGTLYGSAVNPTNAVSVTTGGNTTLQGDSGPSFLGLSGNIVGGGTLTVANTPGNVRFFGSNSGFTGTLVQTAGGGGFYLSSPNAGSSTALWIINGTTYLNGGTGVYNFGTLRGTGNIQAAAGTDTLSIGALNQNSTFAGAIVDSGGTGALTVVGTSTQTLTGANAYSGITAINGGTLVLGGGGVLGSGNYAGTIANNGTFVVNTSSNQTFAGVISGSGNFYQLGSGATSLTNANAYTGNTTLAAGEIYFNNNSALGASSNTLNLSGGTLYGSAVNPTNNVTVTTGGNTTLQGDSGPSFLGLSGNIVGGGTLTVANTPGNVRFFGSNSGFTGTLVQTAGGGGFYLSSPNAGSSAALWIINGTTSLNGGTGVYNFGTLQGTGSILALSGIDTVSIGALNQSSTFGGAIADSTGVGALTIVGTSTQTLTGANAYSGNTAINSGTLVIGGGGSLGNGNYAGNIAIASGSLLNFNSTAAQTFGGVISGSGALQQSGNSALSLNGVNTYTGNTTITAGTLAIGAAGALGSGNYAGTISNSGALVVNTSSNQTFSGVIGGNGSFYQLGPGVTTLVGNNSFSGSTTVSGGTLQVPSGQFAPSYLYVDSVGSASMIQTGGQVTSNLYVGFNSGDVGTYTQSGGTNTVNGTLDLGYYSNSSGSYNLSGSGLLKASTLKIGFTGSGSASGSFTQSGGTNAIASVFALNNGVYNLSGGALTVPTENLNGAGVSFTQAGGTNAITSFFDLDNGAYNLSGGVITAPTEFFLGGSFTQTGGTHIVTNNLYENGPAYNLSGGSLNVGFPEIGYSTSGSFTQSGGTEVANTMTLGYVNYGSYILSGGSLSVSYVYVADAAAGSFTQSGGTHTVQNFMLLGTTYNDGTYNLAGGLLQLAGMGQGGETGVFNFSGGTLQALDSFSTGVPMQLVSGLASIDTQANSLILSAPISGSGSLQKLGAGSLILTNTNTYSGNTTISAGTLTVGGAGLLGGGNYAGNIAINGGASLNFSGASAQTFSGVISGSGGLTQSGNSVLTLGGANTFSGNASITAGTLAIGGSGSLSSGNIAISSGALLNFNSMTAQTFGGVISGSGAVTQSANSLVTLGGANSYSGVTTISAGTLAIGGSGSLGGGNYAGSINIGNGALLNFNSSTNQILSGAISDSGSLTQSGNSVLTINGANAYSGNTNVSAGTLQIPAGQLQSGNIYVDGNSTALLSQTGGSNSVVGNLIVGNNAIGAYSLGGNGSLTAANEYLAYSASSTGTFFQTGGTNNATGALYVGLYGTSGSYSLSGGLLTTPSLTVGYGATNSTFTQTGGTVSAAVGIGQQLPGTYNLGGGLLNASGLEYVYSGTFSQSGGTHTVSTIELGDGGAANYTLSGGLLSAQAENVSLGTSGNFLQTGGTNNVSTLSIPGTNGPAVYTLQNGYLNATTINLTSGGTLNQSGGISSGNLNLSGGQISITGGSFVGNFNQASGTVSSGGTVDVTSFSYSGGVFGARLINDGTFTFTTSFYAGGGIQNDTTITIPAGLAIGVNGGGAANTVDNEGAITLAGGTLAGGQSATSGGPIVNNGLISGYGALTSNVGITNNSQITQSGGNLTISAGIVGAVNVGTIALQSGYQLRITTGTLDNQGTLDLNSSTVAGGGALTNSLGAIYGPGTITAAFQNNGGLLAVPVGTTNVSQGFTNLGTVQLAGLGASLSGGSIANVGSIQGNGLVSNAINNTGTIEAIQGTLTLSGNVQNSSGGLITVDAGAKVLASSGLSSNYGIINLLGGSYDNNSHLMTNYAEISGYGTFRTGGLTNQGDVTFTGATSTINGNFTNASNGSVNVSYNPVTFTGVVVNNGYFKITGTTVTYAGSFSNNGTYISDPAANYFSSLSIGNSGLLQGGNGDQFAVTGPFTNAGQINLGGSSTMLVSNGTGLLAQTAGDLDMGTSATLTAGTVQINGGTLLADGHGATIAASLVYASPASSSYQGWLTGAGNSLTLNNAAARLFLSGTNSYTGATTISLGTLAIGNPKALSQYSAVNVSGGLLDLTAITGGTVGALTVGSGGGINMNIGTVLASFGAINLNGSLTLGGTASSLPEVLLSGTSLSGSFSSFSIPSAYRLSYTSNQVDLIAALASGTPTWINMSAGGSWAVAGNWNDNAVPSGIGVMAILGTSATTVATITLDGAQTLGLLTFQNSNGYTLTAGSAGTLTMDNTGGTGDAQIVVLSGTHSIDPTVTLTLAGTNTAISAVNSGALSIAGNILDGTSGSNAALTFSSSDGTGLLSLSGTNTFAGGLNVNSGSVVLNGAGSLLAGSSLTIGGGAPGAVFTPPSLAQTARASASLAPVPEPGTFGLLVVGGLLLVAFRKRFHAASAQR